MQQPRTEKTAALYEAFKLSKNEAERSAFDFNEETILREFTHWYIIKSRFPYDTMARVNDLLVLKRPVAHHHDMTDSEAAEYQAIMDLITEENYYDALIQNFPRVQSVKHHVHVHLICWHHTN